MGLRLGKFHPFPAASWLDPGLRRELRLGASLTLEIAVGWFMLHDESPSAWLEMLLKFSLGSKHSQGDWQF